MNHPRVTVAIPTYKRPQYTKEAIQSVLNLTYQDFEILVCDNASPDDTEKMVRGFKDPRVRYHRHAKNIGMQRNWRFALNEPQTEYVALLEDDNLFLPHHLESAVAALDSHPNMSFYGCAWETFGSREHEIFTTGLLKNPIGLTECDAKRFSAVAVVAAALSVPVGSSTWVMRRSAIDSIEDWGGKNWPATMDRLWQGQMLLGGGLVFNPRVGAKYRWHDTNITYSWEASGVVTCEIRYVVRTLATIAKKRGLLTPDRLVAEAVQWPSMDASVVVVALAGDRDPDWRRAALEIYRNHPNIAGEGTSHHVTIARRIGAWYLRYADRLHRLRLHWPPKDPE